MNKAFSLVELLIVITVVVVVVAMTTISINNISSSSRITLAAETVISTLTYARQLSTTKWRDIEVRIITMPAPKILSSPSQPRALQLLEVAEGGLIPVTKPRLLPDNTIITSENTLSTIMSLPAVNASMANGDPSIPGVGYSYQYRAFRFRPDGSSNINMLLSGNPLYQITVVSENDAVAPNNPPPNFATIQLFAPTGASFIYRP